ncbi:MAG: NAD-dependent epimerase/dehydratase family protein [Chitinispirillales bacterium]|jgi:UDP-glucose 4-epimerase|nr:NAD-dependent epimerase/dehydratase family protein [Chitinispirillales bacterium]
MQNILVTGATGFIGQHLTRKLLDINGGRSVRAVSKDDSGSGSKLYFFRDDEADSKKADIADRESISGLMDGIDIVYHLAAISRNDMSKTWEDFYAVNVQGTVNLLEEAKAAGVKRFVFVSTVEAAGFGDGTSPRRETDPPNPANNYGKSKLLAERQVLSGAWPMECTVLRLPMIYGPGTFLIVPKLFGMVRRGFYPMFGGGSAKMEFCYVDNAVDGIILAGEKKESTGELFYVSDERPYSIREVVSAIAESSGKKVLFIRIPVFAAKFLGLCWEIAAKILPFPPIISKYSRKPFFSRETVFWTTRDVNTVSTEKIKSALGYSPAVDIKEGTRRTAEWLNQNYFNSTRQ